MTDYRLPPLHSSFMSLHEFEEAEIVVQGLYLGNAYLLIFFLNEVIT